MTKARSEKVIVLGVDGMDPRITSRMIAQGKLPHLAELKERGAMRDDLVLLGAMPTITPPQWTTLSTGSYPETHGITCFYAQHPTELDKITYNLNSASCQSEQLWNVTAEAGKKTLVFHWPGCSWPPTSDSANLHVIDGVTPASINMGLTKDTEKILYAAPEIKEIIYRSRVTGATGAGCILDDLQTDGEEAVMSAVGDIQNVMLSYDDGEGSLEQVTFDVINSPIAEPKGWGKDIPDGAKEFGYITSQGLVRRYCLLVKNEAGVYANVEIYKNKKEAEPLAVLHEGEYAEDLVDEILHDGELIPCVRQATILEIAPDGSKLRLWMSNAIPYADDTFCHPKSLLQQINDNVGYVKVMASCGGAVEEYADKLLCRSWEKYTQWQADALNYLIEANDYEMVFSHIHNVDMIGHLCWRFAKPDAYYAKGGQDPLKYQAIIESVYRDTDKYIGEFLHLLDEGWSMIVTSDHGFLCPSDARPVPFGDALGVNAKVMYELGYTALVKDDDGNPTKTIDWAHTKAIASRTCHIYINLKGRNPHGIVDEADQYALEEDIISALYNYRDEYGRRIVSMAIRNKEARHLGLSGEKSGDIIYFLIEGPNKGHCDTWSTAYGYFDTSLSPIFMAAGAGLKKGYQTERVIRQVDVAPTIAALLGVRMPAQCEGAPAYQIFEEVY